MPTRQQVENGDIPDMCQPATDSLKSLINKKEEPLTYCGRYPTHTECLDFAKSLTYSKMLPDLFSATDIIKIIEYSKTLIP